MSEHLHEMVDPNTIKNVGQLIVAARDGIKTASNVVKRTPSDSYSFSSAAKAASKLIAVYPVLISKSVSSDTAQMVSKYIEQKGCIILQLALQQANISGAGSGVDYLKQFHQNLNIGGDDVAAMGSIINAMIDDIAAKSESTSFANEFAKEKILEAIDWNSILENDNSIKISNQQMKELMEVFSNAEKYQIYDTNLNERSINDFIIKESAGDYRVTIKAFNEAKWQDDIASDNKKYQEYLRKKNLRNISKKEREEQERKQREEEKRTREEIDRKRSEEEREERKQESINKISNRLGQVSFLSDQSVKKMNSAVPSLLIVRFYNSSNATVATEFIIGVKSKVLAVDAAEILRRIANDNADGKSFLNIMRAITGELKISDFLFGLSRTKEDLKSTRIKGAYGDTWNLLQNRAVAAKTAIARGQRNDFAAITTVVISRDDADDLFKEENLDITNPSVAKHFMESYNLLGFAIVDDASESVKFMFDDGNRYFEEFSYRMLGRETEAENYKNMIKLMANSR